MRGSSAGVLGRISEVQLLDVPEDIRFENGGMKLPREFFAPARMSGLAKKIIG